MKEKPELDPLCIKGKIAMAITNRGELIPCCRCDDPHTINDNEFQKLLAVSKISDYNSIDEILDTEEWRNFEENLRNNRGPQACWNTCKKDKSQKDIQTLTVINPENKSEEYEVKR